MNIKKRKIAVLVDVIPPPPLYPNLAEVIFHLLDESLQKSVQLLCCCHGFLGFLRKS